MKKRRMHRGISFLLAMTLLLTSWQVPVFADEVNTDSGSVVVEETVEEGKRVVTTEEAFDAALLDDSVKVIELSQEITLEAKPDKPLVISRPLTIQGGGLSMCYLGIVLGADVTFKDTTLKFQSPETDAIVANGYTLTLENTTLRATTSEDWVISLFCGGINGYEYDNIPKTGTNGTIIIKGNCSVGDIYAGNLTHMTKEDGAYDGNAVIHIENTGDNPTGTIGNIYGCGGRESMGEGTGNLIHPGTFNSPVNGSVEISLYDSLVKQVIGYSENTKIVYNGGAYLRSLTLQNIADLTVESGKLQLEAESNFYETAADVEVAENAQLHLDLLKDVTIGDFGGNGELVLGQRQKLTLTGSAAGSTKVYVGGITGDSASLGMPIANHTYIEAAKAEETNFVFQEWAGEKEYTPVYISDGVQSGSWITPDSDEFIKIEEIILEDAQFDPESETGASGISMPLAIEYTEDSSNLLSLGMMELDVIVNNQEAETEIDEYGYVIYKCDELTVTMMEESLWITDETGNGVPKPGTYQISITVPAEYVAENTESQTQPITVEATLTIAGEEEEEAIEPVQAVVGNWIGAAYSEDELKAYNAEFKINIENIIMRNNVPWSGEEEKYAIDDDWEKGHCGVTYDNYKYNNLPTALEVDFGKSVEVAQIVYRVRQDNGKGFPLKFKIQIDKEGNDNFVDAVEGNALFTYDMIAIKFEPQKCVKLRFVWLEVSPSGDPDPSAAVFYCYKDDGIKPPEVTEAKVENWSVSAGTEEEIASYNEKFRLTPASVTSNRNPYSEENTNIDKAIDDIWTNGHWEASIGGEHTSQGTYLEVAFDELQEVGQIVYRVRQDYNTRGFPKEFKIQISPQKSGNYFVDAVHGTADSTKNFIKITFDKVECYRLRFVWLEVDDTYPSANAFYCYKEDNLTAEMDNLFTDGAATALREGITKEYITDLRERIEAYPAPGSMMSYIEVAEMLIDGKQETDRIHKPITLSQQGDREKERERTDLTRQLSNYDLTGYYVRPGDVLEIFVDADEEAPMPRLVLAAVGRNYGDWYNQLWAYGVDGIALQNGLNQIKVPDDMKGCQVIYFYNPALPEDQAFAPVVRLCGGNKYPVYFYDADDSMEVAKAKEAAFAQELTEYVAKVENNMDEAAKGNGEPNICEFVSEKVLISTTAKGAFKNLDDPFVWQSGIYKEWAAENKDNPKFAVILEDDETGEVTGVRFSGPGAIMQQYEWMYDDMMLYSGFNITDPTHEDYRNRGKFTFRPYTDGAGSAWAMHGYTGFNYGSADMDKPLDDGWFSSIISTKIVLAGGWGEYHEIGHQLDCYTIGYSEATNNLYPMNAQKLYCDTTRLENENGWYDLFANYINNGVMPDNVTFFPGYVIYQLDAVDFIGKSIYPETDISNYGRASRYARLHREELKNLPDILDRLVVSLSMGCGVDLSEHFEYYGKTLSVEAKTMLAGLPKEERPTWLVNQRTFHGGAFDENDKAKTPEITSITVDEKTGYVNIVMDSEIFTEENVQCFSIYRQQKIGEELIGEPEFIGATADNLNTKEVNELYHFTDKYATPGLTYVYSVGVYDCKLIENETKASAEVTIGGNVNVPITRIVINQGDGAATFKVGEEYKVKVNYFPVNANVDLNEIRWWVDGYSEDTDKEGAGKYSVIMLPDPDYPNDPTRRILKGVQYGKTELNVSIGKMTCTQKINVNGELEVNNSKSAIYKFAFDNDRDTFMQGDVYELNLYRTTCDANGKATSEVVKVVTTPSGASWVSSDEDVISVDSHGVITVKKAGTATISFLRGKDVVARCKLTVVDTEVPLTKISLNGFTEEELTNGITMNVGENGKLSYALAPANTTQNGTPTFRSSNDSVVRVEADGTYTAIAGGNATLTVEIGEISETLKVTVNSYVPLRNIVLDTNAVILNGKGSQQTLKVTKYPADATSADENVVWTSDNENVFTVDNGIITAVGTGTATLTASLEGKIATAKVTVEGADPLITGIKFSGHAIGEDISLHLKEGKTHQLAVVIEPKEAASFGNVVWGSSDVSVATVENGYITAWTAGETTITATVEQNETQYQIACNLTVAKSDVLLEGWKIEQKSVSLEVDETLQLQAYPSPLNATIDSQGKKVAVLEWKSENNEIVSVDNAGVITGKKPGTTTVTASGNGFTVSCQVNVTRKKDFDESQAKLEGISLVLEGTIGVNFYMVLSDDVRNNDSAYMSFTLERQNGTKDAWKVPLKGVEPVEENGTTCYVYKCSVPVKDMGTQIKAQVVLLDEKENVIQQGVEYTYTVKEYITEVSANPGKYVEEAKVEKLKTLVDTMNNFGNSATTYFDNAVTTVAPVEQKELEALAPVYNESDIPKKEDSIYYGTSLLLKADTTLRHYFEEIVEVIEVKVGDVVVKGEVERNVDGETVIETVDNGKCVADAKGGLYYVEYNGIAAHELGEYITITVLPEGATTPIEIKYSPLTYTYIALKRDVAADNLTNLMRAMYEYQKAADGYY